MVATSALVPTEAFALAEIQKNILEGSGENGRVIDLQGGWLNEGKLTEMVIRSKDMENKMAVCFLFRLNRAIFTVGV